MFEKLYKSFEATRSIFWSYQRLTESQKNPHRFADFARACILAGRMELAAQIINIEYGDNSLREAAAEAVRWCEETAEAM